MNPLTEKLLDRLKNENNKVKFVFLLKQTSREELGLNMSHRESLYQWEYWGGAK